MRFICKMHEAVGMCGQDKTQKLLDRLEDFDFLYALSPCTVSKEHTLLISAQNSQLRIVSCR
jgi:hypothetical protein